MSARNGLPCKKCGTSEWYSGGGCKRCKSGVARQWSKDNPEVGRLRKQRAYKADPDKVTERVRRWQRENPDRVRINENRRRTKKTAAGGSYTAQEWKALCAQYDHHCLRCGRQEPEIELTADHILPVSMGGSSDISNIQPLCKSCNSSKNAKYIDYRTRPTLVRWIQRTLFD